MKIKATTLKTDRKQKVAILLTPLKGIKACAGPNGRIKTDNQKLEDLPSALKSMTEVEANIGVGWGNALYIRGSVLGLPGTREYRSLALKAPVGFRFRQRATKLVSSFCSMIKSGPKVKIWS